MAQSTQRIIYWICIEKTYFFCIFWDFHGFSEYFPLCSGQITATSDYFHVLLEHTISNIGTGTYSDN